MNVISFNGTDYPEYQAQGFASQFAFPFALHFCKGEGFDIGCNRIEWAFPGAKLIDLNFGTDALELPEGQVDYIFSSHCLEHLPNWTAALDHWDSRLKPGGTLFLYLPHYDQEYWRPWINRKHLHAFTPELIHDYLVYRGYKKVFVSGRDLNHSFMVVGEKA